MDFTNEDIFNYLQSIDINEENALDFFRSSISDNYNTPQGYVFRKVLSQLEVRHHINYLDLAVGQYSFGKNEQILKSVFRGETDYCDKMIQIDKKPKLKFKALDKSILRSIIDSKKVYIGQLLFSIPSEIKILNDRIAHTPQKDIDKIKQLKELLDLAEEKRQIAEREVYDISYFNLPMEEIASKEWKNFFDSNIPELKKVVSEYVEIDIKDLERKRVENGGEIGSVRYIDLNEVVSYITNGIGEFLETQIMSREYIDNLKIDITMQVRLLKFIYQDKESKSFDEIISGIREQFNTTRLSIQEISTNPNSSDYYRCNSLNEKRVFQKNTAKPEEIPGKMKELASRFNKLATLKDEEEYKKEAVRIYLSFIQIHPFADGNGRTSRYLLDYMLIQRGIIPPVLYDTYFDRRRLDNAMDIDIREEGKKDTLLKFIEEGFGGQRQPSVNYISNSNIVKTEMDELSFDEILDSRTKESLEERLQRPTGQQELEANYSMTNPEQRKSVLQIIKNAIINTIYRNNEKGKDNKDGDGREQ